CSSDLPRGLSRDSRDGGILRSGCPECPWRAGRSGAFPRGTREHLPADPVRDIHWKASARMGRWMIKEREAETARAVELRVPVPCPQEEFEACLSEAVTLGVYKVFTLTYQREFFAKMGFEEVSKLYGLATVLPATLASPWLLGSAMVLWIVAPLGVAVWRFK
ncbi:MAG: DUF58 domain-containing protein, partial [Syntrophobacteraceae bacterium]|nr:DUF58 domain-containing protein [Syntrophobacteraceae bacterium]